MSQENKVVSGQQEVAVESRMSMKEFLAVYTPAAHDGKSADEIGQLFTPARNGKSVSSQASQFRARMRKLAEKRGVDVESEAFQEKLQLLVPTLVTKRTASTTERDFADFFTSLTGG